jgi:hypothetical protein
MIIFIPWDLEEEVHKRKTYSWKEMEFFGVKDANSETLENVLKLKTNTF